MVLSHSAFLKFAVLTACLGLLYFRVVQGLVYDWIHLPDFSHGFLIPVISLYFVYERRKRLSVLIPSGEWLGLAVVLFGISILLLGRVAAEQFTMRVSFLILIGGILFFLLGKEFYKTLLFPVAFLVFMIPLPSILMGPITFPMQLLASQLAAKFLDLLAIPVLQEGNIIQLANTTLEVAEACSGIRSLISLLALSVVFAHFSQRVNWKRAALIVSAFPIAIIGNATRVSGTGILAHYYGDSVGQGYFHGFSGWILFVIAFIFLFVLGSLLSRIRNVNKEMS